MNVGGVTAGDVLHIEGWAAGQVFLAAGCEWPDVVDERPGVMA